MAKKESLRTVRFTPSESALVDNYLKENNIFESFSSLARVATLSFMGEGALFHLMPLGEKGPLKRPSFLWDYDLTEIQVREILARPGLSDQKNWLIGRILAQARFEEVMKYLTVDDIRKALPQLRLPPKIKERWEYAIQIWTKHE